MKILLYLLMVYSWQSISAQVSIWQEDFDQYPDGTTTGDNLNEANPALDWTSGGCMACIDTADWWEVKSGVMEARDVNEVVFLQTETIDISRFSDVQFSLEIAEIGDHEGLYFGLDACADQDKEDYVNVLYRIDGGSWNLVSNALSWCGLYASCGSHTLYGDDGINSGDCRDHDDDWGTTTVSTTGLTGNSLEIRLETINSATDEVIRFDNLSVKGKIVLPVTLAAFEVSTGPQRVLLRWQTLSETNNDYFTVERKSLSPEGDWETLALINGAGTAVEMKQYLYEDPQPHNGRSLYRLKQVDFDGNYEYSEIKSVHILAASKPFPNPARDYMMVPKGNDLELPAIIRMYNTSGIEHSINYTLFDSYIMLNISNLNPGYYFYTLYNIKYGLIKAK